MLMWARLWRAGQSPVLAMCVPSLNPLTLTGPASLSATGDTGHCRFIATDPGSACCSGLDFQLPTRFWPCPSHHPVQLDFIFIAEKWVGPPLTNFYKLGSCEDAGYSSGHLTAVPSASMGLIPALHV